MPKNMDKYNHQLILVHEAQPKMGLVQPNPQNLQIGFGKLLSTLTAIFNLINKVYIICCTVSWWH